MILWEDLHQIVFDLLRIALLREPEFAGNALYVCVDNDGWLVINVAQDDIGRLASHAGQSRQLLNGVRHYATITLQKLVRAGDDICRLIAEEACRMDVFAQFVEVRRGEFLQRVVFAKQILRHDIDPRVRTLGAQNDRDQKWEIFYICRLCYVSYMIRFLLTI